MSSNGRMGRNPFQKKAPREVAEEAPTPEQSVPAAELQEALPEVNAEAVSLPSEAVQFISAPSQIHEGSELDSDSEVPSWMKAVAVTYRVALLTRFGAQVAVSEAQQFLHERLRQHQQAKRQGRD